jgi:DNA-binding transcriptional ArsR family regulator
MELDRLVDVFKGLADPTRLRIAAAMIDRPRCGQDLAAEAGVSAATVSHHLKVLDKAGLLRETRQPPYVFYQLDVETLSQAIRAAVPSKMRTLATTPPVDESTRQVLRAFFDGTRVLALPAQRRKKDLVLEEMLRRIPRRREYTEPELNAFISVMFEDFCTVRREWIMGRYMTRENQVYRLADRGKEVIAGTA